jgi:hypothetical protein
VESFEKKGVWWLPDQEASRVGGILSFSSEDGLHLELLGSFRDKRTKALETVPVIFGHADGMMITLGHCLPAGTRMSIPGPTYEAYRPSIALAGAHIPDPLEQTYSKVRITFNHLNEWVGKGGISLMIAQQPNSATPIKAEYTHPQVRTEQLSFGTLRIGFSGRTEGDLIHQLTIHQDVYIDLEPVDPLSFDSLVEGFISPIQGLLTFATDRAANITSLTLFSDDVLFDLGGGRTARIPMKVYKPTREAPESSQRHLLPNDFLFALDDIDSRFNQVIENWFRFHLDIPHCASLLTGTHYSPHLYLDRVFLTLAQVSEIFHRSRFKETKLPIDEFSDRKDLITNLNPAQLVKWILPQMRNDLSFAQRLDRLVREYGECALPLCSTQKAFIRSVVDTRNYYTHYSSKLKQKAAKGLHLYSLSQTLSVLVKCCLLAELGMPAKERRKLFLRNQKYLLLLQEYGNAESRELFTSQAKEARNQLIRAAVKKGRLQQREIASLVGLSSSSVSRIAKNIT